MKVRGSMLLTVIASIQVSGTVNFELEEQDLPLSVQETVVLEDVPVPAAAVAALSLKDVLSARQFTQITLAKYLEEVQNQLPSDNLRCTNFFKSCLSLKGVGAKVFSYLDLKDIYTWSKEITKGLRGADRTAFPKKLLVSEAPFHRSYDPVLTRIGLVSQVSRPFPAHWLEMISAPDFVDLESLLPFMDYFFRNNREPGMRLPLLRKILQTPFASNFLEGLFSPTSEYATRELLLKDLLKMNSLGFGNLFLDSSIELFFKGLESPKEKNNFVENSLFNANILQKLKLMLEVEAAEVFAGVDMQKVVERNAWLEQLTERLWKVSYLNGLPLKKRDEKILGFIAMIEGAVKNVEKGEQLLSFLCALDSIKGAELSLLLAENLGQPPMLRLKAAKVFLQAEIEVSQAAVIKYLRVIFHLEARSRHDPELHTEVLKALSDLTDQSLFSKATQSQQVLSLRLLVQNAPEVDHPSLYDYIGHTGRKYLEKLCRLYPVEGAALSLNLVQTLSKSHPVRLASLEQLLLLHEKEYVSQPELIKCRDLILQLAQDPQQTPGFRSEVLRSLQVLNKAKAFSKLGND